MIGLSKLVGRGLLVVALGTMVFACGDDDGPAPHDDTDGGGGTGGGGGGTSGGGAGDSGGADTGNVLTVAQCVSMTNTNSGGMVPMACVQCGCENGADDVAACDSVCWTLIGCVQTNCAGMTGTAQTTCAVTMCADSIGGAEGAMAAGLVLTSECAMECASTSDPDAGDGG